MNPKIRYPLSALFILLTLLPHQALSQLDSILALPADRHMKVLWDVYYYIGETQRANDSVAQLKEYDLLEQQCIAAKKPMHAQQVWLMRLRIDHFYCFKAGKPANTGEDNICGKEKDALNLHRSNE